MIIYQFLVTIQSVEFQLQLSIIHFKNLGWKDKKSVYQWRSFSKKIEMENSNFAYEVINRKLYRMYHLNGNHFYYYH